MTSKCLYPRLSLGNFHMEDYKYCHLSLRCSQQMAIAKVIQNMKKHTMKWRGTILWTNFRRNGCLTNTGNPSQPTRPSTWLRATLLLRLHCKMLNVIYQFQSRLLEVNFMCFSICSHKLYNFVIFGNQRPFAYGILVFKENH